MSIFNSFVSSRSSGRRTVWVAAGMMGSVLLAANWPQAAGPDGTWRYPVADAPDDWSVTLNRNIIWKTTLPNVGQSGIAVWGDRLFFTTFAEQPEEAPKFSASIVGHCADAKTG